MLFVGVGMLAGSSGPLGIVFDDIDLSYRVGVLALAVILFYGGLDTRMRLFKASIVPASALATLGTVLTMLFVGVSAYLLTDLDLLTSMLLGAVISSTDAAATFASLKGRGLPKRLRGTLETESGTNDPAAVLLTYSLADAITHRESINYLVMAADIALELAIGAALGLALGWLLKQLVNKAALGNIGLYPMLALSGALLAFGLTDLLHGNGYLAIYLVGLILSHGRLSHRLAIVNFMDGAAWGAQLVMFLLMGLLVFPDQLPAILGVALLITAASMFIARPLAVGITLGLLRLATRGRVAFTGREQVLLTWAGLKGAVPIILAMVPLLQRVPGADVIFNVVFVVVIVGTLLQGFTISPLAKLLGLSRDEPPPARLRLELGGDAPDGAAVVDVFLGPDNRSIGKRIVELSLPPEVVVAAVLRGGQLVTPRGNTVFQTGDHVYLIGAHLHSGSIPTAFGRKWRKQAGSHGGAEDADPDDEPEPAAMPAAMPAAEPAAEPDPEPNPAPEAA